MGVGPSGWDIVSIPREKPHDAACGAVSSFYPPNISLGSLDTQGQFSVTLSSRKDSSVLPLSMQFTNLSAWVPTMLMAHRSPFSCWGPGSALQRDGVEEVWQCLIYIVNFPTSCP